MPTCRLITTEPRNTKRIFPYIGGEEINNSPTHAHHRYIINFEDFPLDRADLGARWAEATEHEQLAWLREGIVPLDYPDPVATDWPDLLAIVKERVFGKRASHSTAPWWQFERSRPELLRSVAQLHRVLVHAYVSKHMAFTFIAKNYVVAGPQNLFSFENYGPFCVLQCRIHESWVRFFASTLEDRLSYTRSDCFETFPFRPGFEADAALQQAGEAYYYFRAELMVRRDKGLTKTYNLFHDRLVRDEDIRRLRDLHAEMDRAVLRAYGWDDLAARAEPVFLDETTEDEFAYQGRLFWPSVVRDEVLARLLALNAERHAEELRVGRAPTSAPEAKVAELDEEVEDA